MTGQVQFSVHVILHEYAVPTYLEVCFGSCLIKGQQNISHLIPVCVKVGIMSFQETCPQISLTMPARWKVVRIKMKICTRYPAWVRHFLQEHKLQTCHRSPVPNWYKNPKFSTVLTIFPSWNVSSYLESRCISNAVNFLQV